MPRFSVVIPVYNRPQELDELLDSLCRQHYTQFEVIVVDDGSATPCEEVCTHYVGQLDIHYFYKQNAGPGPARNYGAQRAKGEYLIILDSDVILPEHYFDEIVRELDTAPADAFGGPDRAHDNFTPVQKAINYAMTSFFTTGGIRGGKKKMDKFYPRSFNLGIRTDVFCALNGFAAMRFGEDIDLSIRIFAAGCQCRLFPEAWVWHKRRATFRQFFKQVHNSGIARINLYKKYPSSLKLVHCLPAVFTLGVVALYYRRIGYSRLLARYRGGNIVGGLWVAHSDGCGLAEQKRIYRSAFRCCSFYSADRLRHRFLACLLAACRLAQRRLSSLPTQFLQIILMRYIAS